MTIQSTKRTPFKTVFLSVIAGIFLTLSLAFLALMSLRNSAEATEEPDPAWVAAHPDEYRDLVLKAKHRSDPILALYRDGAAREEVIAFFSAIVHSEDLAKIILQRAEEYDVSPSLAAALSWEESKFNPTAVNKNKSSVDRGLFQLNSKSFPNLAVTDFFNPDINAKYGIAHLRWVMDLGGTDVAGLAMYNAGTNRVKANTTPKATLDYISRILEFKSGVDDLFARELETRWVIAGDGSVRPAAPKRSGDPRLAAALLPLFSAPR